MLRSIPSHLSINLSQMHFHTSRWTRSRLSLSTFNTEIFNAYQYKIYKLDFFFNNFHILRFSRSGKREVDVNSSMSNHSSDYNALFCYDPLAQLAIDASSRMKSSQSRPVVKFFNEEKSPLHKLLE